MRIGYELAIEQQQKLIMTPELKFALKILQLPSMELEQLIQSELEANPILEVFDDENEDKSKMKTNKNEKEKEIDWKEYLQFRGKSYCLDNVEHDENHELSYENIITYDDTLKDHLMFQLNLSFVKHELREIGEFIIECLDENGYLTMSTEDIADILKSDKQKVEKILEIIQTFEPLGVGARDLRECLLIQLKSKGLMTPSLQTIINDCLDDIAGNRIQNIAKKLAVSIDEAQKLSDIVKNLEPKPGRSFECGSSTRYVVPDVYIDKIGNEYHIYINDYNGSRLIINQYYRDILKSEDKASQASVYINSKLTSAMWLIKSLEHRKNTLYSVMKAILEYQIDFFEKGIMYLRTMTLKAIADTIGVHESTVSRAINGKYVQTPKGIFEIKYFFTSGVDNAEGDAVSSESIKRLIKQYIDNEDAIRPLSDQNIADMLTKSGYMISRRTIAKYRDELNIPASSRRKRYS